MKITKHQLRKIIRESSSYEEIMRIRNSGDYEWQDMEYEVVDLMRSMQTFSAQDVIDIMYDALDAEDREDSGFWHMMLSDGGHLYEALDGLKATADEEYDPDRPMEESHSRNKIRKIVRESIVQEYGRSNSPPPRDSNWRAFADNFDIGVLDLDAIAYDLGFQDFRDMDRAITPRRLAMRDQRAFITALQDSSGMALDLSDNEILRIATASPGMRVPPLAEADLDEGTADVPKGWDWIEKKNRKYYR
jgi:hypothetical protein